MQKNAPSIIIKKGTPEDADLIQSITSSSFSDYSDSEVPPSALSETIASIRNELAEGGQMAALCYFGDKPAGCVRFYIEDGLYFRRLGVIPQFRGKGVSTSILRWLEEYARNHGETRIWCRTRSSWEKNVRIYAKLGFSITSKVTKEKNGHMIEVVSFSKELKADE